MPEATVGLLRVILTANTAEFESAMKRTSSAAAAWSKDLKSIGQQATQLGSALTRTLTVPLLGVGVGAAKLAMDFESSFAGVRKTVKATQPEFAVMAQQFRDLSKEIPVNVNELNRLAEAAGAMDIPKEAIVDFTRVMALLGVTTNVTSEQAATDIGKIQNIFGAAGKDTDRFAATLVALGNEGASTEQEILSMATRIAAAGHTVGMTQGQVLAFGSALSSVGLEAEAGGTAISRTFFTINDAVMSGGAALDEFARVAGMSVESFKKAFQEDAASATTAFISGLDRIKVEGENVNQVLKGLELGEIRVRDTLIRAAGAGDLLTKALNLQGKAWQDANAHTKEAAERFKTTESQLTLLWNRVKDVGITLGNALLPTINLTIQGLNNLVPVVDALARAFGALPEWVQATTVGFGLLAAAAGPLLFVFGQLAMSASALIGLFGKKGLATRALAALLPSLTTATAAQAAANTAAGATATTAAVGLNALKVAAIGLGQAFGAIAVVGGSAVLVYRAITEAVNLSRESTERASMAANEQERRYAMMAQAAKIAGHSVHTYDAAVAIVIEHQRKLADELKRTEFIGPQQNEFIGPLQSAGAAAAGLAAQLAAAQAKVAALSTEQRAAIDAALKMGQSHEEAAKSVNAEFKALDLMDIHIRLYTEGLKGATKVTNEFADSVARLSGAGALKDAAEALKQLTAAGGPSKILPSQLEGLSETFKKAAEAARLLKNTKLAEEYEALSASLTPVAQLQTRWNVKIGEFAILERQAAGDTDEFTAAILSQAMALEKPVEQINLGILAVTKYTDIWVPFKAAVSSAIGPVTAHIEKTRTLTEGIGALSQAFSQLAQVAGGKLGEVTEAIGRVISSMNLGIEAGKTFVDGFAQALKGGAKNIAASLSSLATGLVGGFSAIMGATSTDSRLKNVLGGAATGASMGATIGAGIAMAAGKGMMTAGIWGAAAGAIVGIFIGVFRGRDTRRLMEQVGNDWGQDISKGVAETIKKDAKKMFEGSLEAAEAFNLSNIISDMGGLTDKNLGVATAKLRDVFVMVERGLFSAGQAAKVLDENWRTFIEAGTDATGRLSPQLLEIIALTERFGIKSKEIQKFLEEQSSIAVSGFGQIAAAAEQTYKAIGERVQKARDAVKEAEEERAKDAEGSEQKLIDATNELNEALRIQKIEAARAKGELADLGVIALATFNATLKATGGDFGAALQASSGAISTLQQAYDALGISTEDAGLAALFLQNTILQKNPALIAGVAGLSQSMVALHNMGMLNAETFGAMQRTGAAMYTRLQAEAAALGGTTRDALLPMQGFLQQAAAQAKALGIPLDDVTQMLIDQSKELGIWKDLGPSAAEAQTIATKELTAAIKEMADEFKGFFNQLRGIPDELPNPFRHWEVPDLPQIGEGDGIRPVPMATGGLVTRPTLALLGERGPELITPLSRRYGNPSRIPIPDLSAIAPPRTVPGVNESPDWRIDFRDSIREMREDLKVWLESFTDSMAVTMRDAAMGAV